MERWPHKLCNARVLLDVDTVKIPQVSQDIHMLGCVVSITELGCIYPLWSRKEFLIEKQAYQFFKCAQHTVHVPGSVRDEANPYHQGLQLS